MLNFLFISTLFLLPAVLLGDDLSIVLNPMDDVGSQYITVPLDTYKGTVSGYVTPLQDQDMMLCISWLVPPEAPLDADLQSTWPAVCDFAQNISAQENPTPVFYAAELRSGVNYFTAAIIDYNSDGMDQYTVQLTSEIDLCENTSQYGPSCAPYADIEFGTTYTVTAGTYQYMLPTFVNSTKYVQYHKFSFTGNFSGSSLSYRLSGPADLLADGSCPDLSKGCQITTPPMTRSNAFWFLTVVAVDTFNMSVSPSFCSSSSNFGKDCKNTFVNGSKLTNSVSQYTGSQYFVFSAPAFEVAVGGLDGYEQTDDSPTLTVQVDNVPSNFVLSSGINSKSNRLTIDMTGSDQLNDDSQFIVFVNTKGSFGIWIPTDNTTCANDCSNRGTCSDFICECPSSGKPKYNGLGCEHEVKNFTIEYVILISVGGLLVLAIVIGVPVYCWMNRHADYETVA